MISDSLILHKYKYNTIILSLITIKDKYDKVFIQLKM